LGSCVAFFHSRIAVSSPSKRFPVMRLSWPCSMAIASVFRANRLSAIHESKL